MVFKCRACKTRIGIRHMFYQHFGGCASCPRCGTVDVEKRSSRDKIDKVSGEAWSVLMSLVGGSLFHCVYCRIQFYDLRGSSTKSPAAKSVPESASDRV